MKKKNLITYRAYKILEQLEQTGAYELNASDSNKKLVPNDEIAFLIWNLPAVTTCPYATEHCKHFCYAKKAETAYPDCLPCRQRNFEESRRADFVDNMTYTILKRRNGTRKKWLVVRIHESVDFYNPTYAAAWLQIMRNCTGEKIKFIAYTKSFPFFDGVDLPSNFFLRASIWDDTPEKFLDMIEKNQWRTYTAVDQFRTGDSFTRCRCSDCAGCGKCWKKYQDIRCEIH